MYITNKMERFSFKGGHVIQVAKHLKRLVYNSVATGSGRPGHLGHLLSGSKWVSPGHAYMPDPDQNCLVIMCIKNCNEKIDTL